MPRTDLQQIRSVTDVTRRAIVDALILEDIAWAGDVDEVEFLSRLFNLKELQSTDGRYPDAGGDIWKHRIMNNDWDPYWVFSDSRFDLMHGPDELFLRFLCEMVHPVVRRDRDQAAALVGLLNEHLGPDGWELSERMAISGRPVYAARRRLAAGNALQSARTVAEAIDADYVNRQITRMESAIDRDPELAIGTAKELIETVCKTILHQRNVSTDASMDFPKLVRATLKELKLTPDDVDDQAKAANATRLLLNNLATISNGMAELRNALGTGHGKNATANPASPRHARLAVGAAATLVAFLFESHQEDQTRHAFNESDG